MRARFAHRAATVAGWLAIAIGLVHVAFTSGTFDQPSLDALWFVGSGFFVVMTGAITLLARRHAVRTVAVLANGAGLALAVVFGALTEWREPQGLLLAMTFLIGGVASWMCAPAAPMH